ncbi:hypothetical protein [Pseudomonas defluvii]|uniref:hypothetical protein n=1 Tax=Pseudomonas defluvii TaxID=1876757 RepID=UPI003905E542
MNRHALTVTLIIALLAGIPGCASKAPAPETQAPVVIPESTWQQVDWEIVSASQAVTDSVKDYARRSMKAWRDRVYQQTEADFIPWFTSYWTQQWLTIKVAWYKMNAGNGAEPGEKRLAAYLQEQYHERVLEPVAKEIDPDAVMQQAIVLYAQLLGPQLQGIVQRYRLPPDQFNLRLSRIPAISLGPPPTLNASLYQLVYTNPVSKLPAYTALVTRVRTAAGATGADQADAVLSSVAQRTSEKLESTLPVRGAASATAAAVGRVAGMMISLVVTGVGALMHDSERPEMVEQLRVILNVALDEEWAILLENRASGVMAGVYYLAEQIESSVRATDAPPGPYEPQP